MIITMTINTEQEKLKRCIAAAWQNRNGDELPIEDIKDFAIRDEVTKTDIENMLLGSSLGELVELDKVEMKITG